MALSLYLRSTAIALSLASIPLAGCATAPAGKPVASAAHRASNVPFTAANVEALRDGGGYRISWQATGADKVRVFASTNPDGTTSGTPVAQGTADGSATVPALAATGRPYFTLVPDRGTALTTADRGLHFASVPNWRDIGGYRTDDGHWVRMGMIYRADQLDKVSDADMTRIDALNPAVIIDLRTKSERSREPDKIPPRARGLVLDVAADSAGTLGGDMREAMAAISTGKGAEMLTAANRDFVSLPSALTAYTGMMRELLQEKDGAIVYHCTAGKDRTGWATAIILSILGVPRDTIMADYLLSNQYLKAKNEATIAMFKKSGAPFDVSNLEPVITVRPEYLQAAFDEVDRKFGSFDAYAHKGLGLTDADIAALRTKYLIGPVG